MGCVRFCSRLDAEQKSPEAKVACSNLSWTRQFGAGEGQEVTGDH